MPCVPHLDERSDEVRWGRIAPADRMLLRRWLATNVTEWPGAFAIEACTGWRFQVKELRRAGSRRIWPSRLALRPRGPKRLAKTDRAEARRLRELLAAGRLRESWIPPEQVLEMREAAAVP